MIDTIMLKRLRIFSAGFIIILALVVAFTPNNSEAATIQTCDGILATAPNAVEQVYTCCPNLPGYFYMVYDCIHNILRVATGSYLQTASNLLRNSVGIVMVIALILLGIRYIVRGGGQELEARKVETMVLAFKFGLIGFFLLSGITNLEYYTTGIKNASQEISGEIASAGFGTPITNIWKNIDKVVISFVAGVRNSMTIDNATNIILISALIVGLIFSGALGFVFFTLAIGAVISIFTAFAICIAVHFTALIAITFLMALAPLFLPLMLFNKNTIPRSIFDEWINALISYSFQPIILTAFMAIMMVVIQSFINEFYNEVVNTAPGLIAPFGFKVSWWKIISTPVPSIFIGIPYPDLGWPSEKIFNVIGRIFVILITTQALIEMGKQVPAISSKITEGRAPELGKIANDAMKGIAGITQKKLTEGFQKAPNAIRSAVSATYSEMFRPRANKKRE